MKITPYVVPTELQTIDLLNRGFVDNFFRDMIGGVNKLSGYSSFNKYSPPLEFIKKDSEWTIKLELPGLNKEDISIELNGSNLSIKGERRYDEKDIYHSELYYGSLVRQIELPWKPEKDSIKAEYKDGILYIKVPKTLNQESAKINIT